MTERRIKTKAEVAGGEEVPVVGVSGVRIARICPAKDCMWRTFGDPKAKCPEHGRGADQANKSYFGQPT